jgi:hypothetical protein
MEIEKIILWDEPGNCNNGLEKGSGRELWHFHTQNKLKMLSFLALAKVLLGLQEFYRRYEWQGNFAWSILAQSIISAAEAIIRSISSWMMTTENCS